MQAGKRALWFALSCGLMLVGGALADVLEPPVPVVKTGAVNAQAVNTAPTFVHTTGKFTTDFGGYDIGQSVILQPDGRIVVAGYSQDRNGKNKSALVRYRSDGTLDPDFGTGGLVTTDLGAFDAVVYSVILQPDGRIVAAGSGGFVLSRYLSDGSLDPAFGAGGAGHHRLWWLRLWL